MNYFNLRMQHFMFIICLFLISTASIIAQNNGKLQGIVTTSDGDPATGVNIIIKNTKYNTITDDKGGFELNRIKSGNYTIQISLTGYERLEQDTEITDNKTTILNLQLNVSNKQLQEVTIYNNNRSKLFPKQSIYVSKMPLNNLENPQVYNVATADLLKEQAATNLDEALKNIPGIQKIWGSTGRGGDGGSYYTLRGFQVQANIINGLPGLTNGSLDPANTERIEIIKGPSGTLFGSSLISYGGLINTVTKKPYSGFGAEISYLAGSFGMNRVAADVNTSLDQSDNVSIRINTSFQTENSFQDAGFRTAFFVAPSLSYKVSEKLSFLINTEFMQEERAVAPIMLLGRNKPLQFANIDQLNYNPKLSFQSNDLPIKTPKFNLQAQMNYKISDQWTSQTALSTGSAKSNGYYSYLGDNEDGQSDFSIYITKENSHTTTTDIQQNFNGDFKIGNLRNRIVIGLDYFQKDVMYGGTGWNGIYKVTPQGEIRQYDDQNPNFLTQSSVDKLLSTTGNSNYHSRENVYSAYASDVINITPKLLAMASLRVDYFDNKGDITTDADDYNQIALSPKFGLVYQPIEDKLALFANYMNGFKNISPNEGRDSNGNSTGIQTFEPEHANQLEFGFKANLLNDKLNATISYYDINVANLVTSNLNYSAQGGEARSKGFEFDLNASPIKGLHIIAGYSYNDSKVTKGDLKNPWLEEGKRPMSSGAENLVNFWATYKFVYGTLKDFGLGFGGNYASENAVVNSELLGKFVLPSYTVLNGSVFYGTNKFRVALNINNIANKDYFNGGWGSVNPQKPRNVVASFSYKF
jgi:iron complex outermembrane receptor protein